MNHMNIFNYFESRKPQHEDVLTRNFLILLKNIPLVQVGFFELIRDTMLAKNVQIDSSAQGVLRLSEIYTQVDNNDKLFKNMSDINMLSVIISDDVFQTDHIVKNDDRHARYDGVVVCEPSWVFIIENKPSINNIWENQLNPNIHGTRDINLIKEPCTLSWRNVISLLNEFLSSSLLNPLEHTMIGEFIEYVDENYSWLNPYYRFDLCKSNKYLLDRRCCSVMDSYSEDVHVGYHKGWKHYINIGNECVKEIALDSEIVDKNTWTINLWMYAGDIMSSAKKTYNNLDVEKLLSLPLKDPKYSLSTNFHFSFRSTGLMWLDCPSSFKDYVEYWKNNSDIKQIKREEFKKYFDFLADNGIVNCTDLSAFEDQIIAKKYQTLNVCPGFLIKYTWSQSDAIILDNKRAFEEEFKKKINEILSVFE